VIEQTDHVRVIEAGGGVHFVPEVRGEVRIGRVRAHRDLDRDRSARGQVGGTPDLSHPATRDWLEELECASQA
jgi:hypothetical protein